jgi:ABC-type sugar transport system ATPase subunit
MFVGGFIGSPAMNMLAATRRTPETARWRLSPAMRESNSKTTSSAPIQDSSRTRDVRSCLGIRPESLEDASLDETAQVARLRGHAIPPRALGADVLVTSR